MKSEWRLYVASTNSRLQEESDRARCWKLVDETMTHSKKIKVRRESVSYTNEDREETSFSLILKTHAGKHRNGVVAL